MLAILREEIRTVLEEQTYVRIDGVYSNIIAPLHFPYV